jgi:UDP-N-acetylglucosamine 1-carboxyvinyltransferase
LPNIDYKINVYQVAIEPHVRNLIYFLNNAWADITLNIDHSITMTPQPINIKKSDFTIISDYIEAWTYFAIWAGADNSEITLKNVNVDDLSSMYNIAEKIWIYFKIIDKNTIKVNSFNKKNYKSTKFETRIFPWFPTDLQSIFGTLLTQANWRSKLFETLFEWRFSYLTELENLWADIEVLNPHQVLVIWPTELIGGQVTSTDLRWWWAMVLAGIMAKWTTNIMSEDIILRWYDHILEKLQKIWVDIKKIKD